MGGQGSWSASHMEVAAELEHRHLATKAERPIIQAGGGHQSRALGRAGPKSREKARKQEC